MDVVFGGGKFGLKAVKWLIDNKRDFVVIDSNEDCLVRRKLKEFDGKGEFLKGGVKELTEILLEKKPELVFPTAPIHLAAALVKEFHKMEEWDEKVNCILSGLPSKVIVSVGRGSVVVSYNRDATCLEDCSAPDICPVTKIKKPAPMYELVRFAVPDGFVIKSEYLEPGLGAIKGDLLRELLESVGDRIVVATACRCHGVVTSLKR
uniref:RCK N-terminal domain-containing protein n=1 Tax=Geoglobus ahangari TaxID=113653 RepID=A0A7C4S8Y5_9EURY